MVEVKMNKEQSTMFLAGKMFRGRPEDQLSAPDHVFNGNSLKSFSVQTICKQLWENERNG